MNEPGSVCASASCVCSSVAQPLRLEPTAEHTKMLVKETPRTLLQLPQRPVPLRRGEGTSDANERAREWEEERERERERESERVHGEGE